MHESCADPLINDGAVLSDAGRLSHMPSPRGSAIAFACTVEDTLPWCFLVFNAGLLAPKTHRTVCDVLSLHQQSLTMFPKKHVWPLPHALHFCVLCLSSCLVLQFRCILSCHEACVA